MARSIGKVERLVPRLQGGLDGIGTNTAPKLAPAESGFERVREPARRAPAQRQGDAPVVPLRTRRTKLPAEGRFDARREARAISRAFDTPNHWTPFLERYTTRDDVAHVKALAKTLAPRKADEILVRFFRTMVETRESQPPAVAQMFEDLPKDWYQDPIYYAYVQYFGTPKADSRATFDDLIRQLDHLEYLGVRNIFLLPHYESPGGDGGYDVSAFEPDRALGGREAYERFMEVAIARGFRVMTDIPANHTSTQHGWFQALLRGDREKLDYYVRVDGARKLVPGTVEIEGRPRSLIKHADDSISAPWLIFPHASDKNWIDVEVGGERHQMFHTFYPFQVDLNLANPKVLEELLQLLGSEANVGNAGKRMDAAPHWFKRPGTDFESLAETHALQAIFKSFLRHVVPRRGITLPEVGFGIEEATKYFGRTMPLAGEETNSEGDGIFAFEMQAGLREMIFTGDAAPFWRTIQSLPELPEQAVWLNMLGHHDEMRTDLMSEGARGPVRAMLMQKGALDFAGRGLGGRTANFLDGDPRRIANAYFALFMAPGTPVIYYGDEIGALNQPDFMEAEQKKRHEILNALGVETRLENARDTRDLNRGPIPRADFERARAEKYLPVETIRALNALRDRYPALRGREVEPLPVDREDVLALTRSAPGAAPIVALSNLSGERRTVRVPRAALEAALGPIDAAVQDLLATQRDGEPRRLAVRADGDRVLVELEPYATHLLVHAPRSARS